MERIAKVKNKYRYKYGRTDFRTKGTDYQVA